MEPFAQIITAWYDRHKRTLPWRDTKDPYHIWISEVILQQTQVAQGYDYYNRFISAFPSVNDLAQAPLEQVLRLWQGLGYYSRARNLHHAAQQIVTTFGRFPDTYHDIISLKGVGDYTASAIASFAFGQCCAVVDGNVYRVLSRHFGIDQPIDKPTGQKYFKQLATTLIDRADPGRYNQAIMEFGALHCTPRNPQCSTCPLAHSCCALADGRVQMLPVKAGKVKVSTRHFAYVYVHDDSHLYLRQRQAKDIWQGLFEPLLIETSRPTTIADVSTHPQVQRTLQLPQSTLTELPGTHKHVLTHRHLMARFYVLTVPHSTDARDIWHDFLHIPTDRRDDYAVPRLVELLYEQLT